MTQRFDRPQLVAVYSDGSSFPIGATMNGDPNTGKRFEQVSGQMSGQTPISENVSAQKSAPFPYAAHANILGRGDSVPPYDPRRIQREFPTRWQAYIRANYYDIAHVVQVFRVSERCARKWWKGETGANGAQVIIACNEHPVAAQRMLIAAE